jgi:hypothetical protein
VVSQKSEEDIKKMMTAVTNIFNKTPNPIANVNTVNDPTVLSQISNLTNNLNSSQLNEMDIENKNTDDIVNDFPFGPPFPTSHDTCAALIPKPKLGSTLDLEIKVD